MRTTEERISAMHQRAAELKRERRKKQTFLAGGVSIAVCLALVILLALWIPGSLSVHMAELPELGMSGSIFSNNYLLGYIIIAIIAFLLGISVTVFCFRLKKWRDDRDNEEDQ